MLEAGEGLVEVEGLGHGGECQPGILLRAARFRLADLASSPEYWIVDPVARTLEVHRLANAAYIVTSVARDRDVIVSPTIDGLPFGAATVFVD